MKNLRAHALTLFFIGVVLCIRVMGHGKLWIKKSLEMLQCWGRSGAAMQWGAKGGWEIFFDTPKGLKLILGLVVS